MSAYTEVNPWKEENKNKDLYKFLIEEISVYLKNKDLLSDQKLPCRGGISSVKYQGNSST